jgi:N-acetylneuraminic acid mutarotase
MMLDYFPSPSNAASSSSAAFSSAAASTTTTLTISTAAAAAAAAVAVSAAVSATASAASSAAASPMHSLLSSFSAFSPKHFNFQLFQQQHQQNLHHQQQQQNQLHLQQQQQHELEATVPMLLTQDSWGATEQDNNNEEFCLPSSSNSVRIEISTFDEEQSKIQPTTESIPMEVTGVKNEGSSKRIYPVWRKLYDFTEEIDAEDEEEDEESEGQDSDEEQPQQQQQQQQDENSEESSSSRRAKKRSRPTRKHDITFANNSFIPAPRSGHSCALVEQECNSKSFTQKLLIFGGFCPKPINNAMNDLWEFDIAHCEWKKIHDCDDSASPNAPLASLRGPRSIPQARVGHSGALTSLPTISTGPCSSADGNLHDASPSLKFINFSGRNDVSGDFRDVWELDVETHAWKQLECKGEMPPEFILHSAVCHENKMLIFGGWSWGIFNTLFQLDLATHKWKKLECKGAKIKARERHSAVVFENKMVVFGGHANEEYLSDVAELDLSTLVWTQKKCCGDLPPGMRSHTAVVDSSRRKMVVFAGKTQDACSNDLYELDFDSFRWQKRSVLGDLPESRGRHTCVMSERNGKMIVFSGTNGRIYFNDLFVCDFGRFSKDISNLFDPN